MLSYELNLLLFFLLFVLHEVEGTRATRDISDRIKRTDLFDSMASPKMKFMQTHFHARNLYMDKIMRFSWKIVKERERERDASFYFQMRDDNLVPRNIFTTSVLRDK